MNLEGKLEIAGLSDVGRRRSHNEDSIASDIAVGIAVLADGVGGNNAGEVASSIAVHTIVDSARESLRCCFVAVAAGRNTGPYEFDAHG